MATSSNETRITHLARAATAQYEQQKIGAEDRIREAQATFPDNARLEQLPRGTIAEVRAVALNKVKMLFLPRLFLRRWIAAQRALTNSRLPSDITTLASIQKLKESFPWLRGVTDDVVIQLQAKCHKRSFRHGEVVSYENTPLKCMKVVILMEGTVDIDGQGVQQAPLTLNDYATLERTTADFTVRAVGIVDAVWVYASDILELLDNISAAAKSASQSSLTYRRNLFSEKVVTLDELSTSTLFRAWPTEDQLHVIGKFSPMCLGVGETTQQLRHHLILVHSGRLLPLDPIAKSTIEPEVSSSGTFIGEVEAFLGVPQQTIYQADFNTNVFVLHRSTVKRMLAKAALNDISGSMVRRLHQEALLANRDNAALIFRALREFPLLGHRLTEFELKDFFKYVEPQVFLPQEVMCSTSEFCQQMILVVRGRATIRCDPPSAVCVGEPIGFTLLVEHKWKYLVVAESMVEAVVLPITNMLQFFADMEDRKRGSKLAKQMKHDTMVLMNPSSHTLAEFAEVQASVVGLQTLSLYESDVQRCSSSKRPSNGIHSGSSSSSEKKVSELVKQFVSPNRPLPAKTTKGRSDIFYSRTTRSSTLAFHSKLLKPTPPSYTDQVVANSTRGGSRSPLLTASFGRTDSPNAEGPSSFSSRRHASLADTSTFRQSPMSGSPPGSVAYIPTGVTPTAGAMRQRRGRLHFKEQRSLNERLDQTMHIHRQKVDGAWSRAGKATRNIVPRLYPPNFSRQFGSDPKLSRGHSFASSGSRDSGTTPRSSAASQSTEQALPMDPFVAEVELNVPVPKVNSEAF